MDSQFSPTDFFLPILAPVLNLIDLLLLCCAQSCLLFCDPIDCCPPCSSAHGISYARMLEWVAISYSRGTFLTQWSNSHLLCVLHWQVDSLLFCHWEALNLVRSWYKFQLYHIRGLICRPNLKPNSTILFFVFGQAL